MAKQRRAGKCQRHFGRSRLYTISQKISTAGARRGATQIFDLIRGTCVKTVAEQSALLRRECDALQLTALERVSRTPFPLLVLSKKYLINRNKFINY